MGHLSAFTRHQFPHLHKREKERRDSGDLRRSHAHQSGEERNQSAITRAGPVAETADHSLFESGVGAFLGERVFE